MLLKIGILVRTCVYLSHIGNMHYGAFPQSARQALNPQPHPSLTFEIN